MRLVYMGSPAIAIPPVEHLLKHHKQVVGIVSQAPKPQGRHRALINPPVAEFSRQHGIPCLQPDKASAPDFLATLASWEPDIIITCAYGQILTSKFLAIPKRATINIHPSALPRYRGATPVQSSILAGEEETALSILFTVKALDAGNLILQEKYKIAAGETAPDLSLRLFTAAGPLLLRALDLLEDPAFQGIPQDQNLVTHCKKIEKSDGKISWQDTSETILRRYRAYYSWPGSYTFLGEKRILCEQLAPHPQAGKPNLKPGDSYLDQGELLIKTGTDYLKVKRLKPAGGKSLNSTDFWRGHAKNKEVIKFET